MTSYTVTLQRMDNFDITVEAPDFGTAEELAIDHYLQSENPEKDFGIATSNWEIINVEQHEA